MALRNFFRVAAIAALVAVASTGSAQLGGIGDRLKKRIPSPTSLLEGRPPISTSLADARWADPTKDGFTPREPERSLMTLQRTPNGGFVLQPGYYVMHTQSYCLHAGTHGPGGGDGYLYAPPKGSAEDAVMTVVRNSVSRPEIPQQTIQQLLWAIVARAKFEDLRPELRAAATQLLTTRQLATLNRSALDMVPGPLMDRAMSSVPGPVRQVLQAEGQLRQMLTSPGGSFAEMERVAVLSGAVGMGPGSRAVPSGRWSLHPDGYYVRYIPQGYSYTVTQIWVPQGTPAVGKEYDPATHIAVPGNTSRQRLIQSGRAHQGH